MAISGGDGSIILATQVDPTGLTRGLSSIRSNIQKTSSGFSKLGGIIATAFSVHKIIQFSKESSKMASDTEASIQRLIDIYGASSKSIQDFIDANARALGMSKSAAKGFSAVYGNLFSVWADQETNARLTEHYLRATAVVASKTGRTMQDVQERIRSGLLGNTEAVEDLGIFVNVKTIEMTEAFQRVAQGAKWDDLTAAQQSQVRTLAILEQATKKYGTEVANTTSFARLQYQAAFEDFKDAWGNVVNIVLVPALKIMTTIFNVLAEGLKMISGLSGKEIKSPEIPSNNKIDIPAGQDSKDKDKKEEEKQIDSEIKAIQKKIKALQKENKQIAKNDKANQKANKRQLASFDDLTMLSDEQSSKFDEMIEKNNEEIEQLQEQIDLLREKKEAMEEISSVSNTGDISKTNIESIQNIASKEQSSDKKMSEIVQNIEENLNYLMETIGLSLVAIGLILMATGNIPWGIGFIIAGAYIYNVSASSEGQLDFQQIKSEFETIVDNIEEILIAIGIVLLFFGQLGWGIGFIVAGAVIYGVKELQSSKYDTADVTTKLAVIMEAVSVSLIGIGVILIFFGWVALGIGFIFVGKELLSVQEQQLNESGVTTKIQEFLTENSGLIVGVGIALVVIGIICFCFGILTPLTFGIFMAGAAVLAAEEAVNPNAIKEEITKFFEESSALVIGVSSALLVLGIILCCTGVALPLGIGLIVVGAAGLAAEVALNWEFVKEKITNFFQTLYEWVTTRGILILGIILATSGVNLTSGLNLMSQGGVNLAKAQDPLWTTIVDKVKEVWEKIKIFWSQNIAKWFTAEHWGNLGKQMMDGLIEKIENGISKIKELISNVSFGSITSGISSAVAAVQGALTNINSSITASSSKINSLTSKSFMGFSGNSYSTGYSASSYSIPRLAQGAVIPPNREFLAILGDQKQGANIEAPLDTIVQAMNIALAENTSQKNETAEIVLEMNGREFGRAAIDLAKRENRIRGTRMVFV